MNEYSYSGNTCANDICARSAMTNAGVSVPLQYAKSGQCCSCNCVHVAATSSKTVDEGFAVSMAVIAVFLLVLGIVIGCHL